MNKTKKILCFVVSLLLTSSLLVVFSQSEYSYEFDCSSVIVTIKSEYTMPDKLFTTKDFDLDLVDNVIDLMPMTKRNYQPGNKGILKLCLKDASPHNVITLVNELKMNSLVEVAEPNYYYYALDDFDSSRTITASDARQILRYSSRLDTFNSLQGILSDYDLDGVITATDARAVLRLSAGLE